ncbi:MAG: acyltransferase family protein [Microbacterium sp.]|uniref:acyltransferase family protein n=1 Tax=Microbacterium sp. TaxID=51671 RepID=UPI003F7FEE0A
MTPAPAGERTERIAAIDGLRALAFLLVFAFHSWQFAGAPDIPVVSTVIAQNIRPDFFVVLTGFVLFLPFARDPSRLGRFSTGPYLKRRLRRIVLPYYVALAYAILLPQALVVLMKALGRDASWQPWPSIGDLLSHLTFTHMFFPQYWSTINGSLWTMALEMQLYLIFPLVMLAAARWGLRAVFGAIVVSVLFRIGVDIFVGDAEFSVVFLWAASGLGRLTEFSFGMLAAVAGFRVAGRMRRPHVIAVLAVMVVAYLVATEPFFRGTVLPIRDLGLSMLFGGLIVLVLTVRPIAALFAWRPISWLGYRSYSLFLIHQPTLWYLSEFLQKFTHVPEGAGLLALLWTVGFAVVLGVGQALFVTVERPCIAWAKQVPSSRAPAGAPPQPLSGPAAPLSGPASGVGAATVEAPLPEAPGAVEMPETDVDVGESRGPDPEGRPPRA